MDLSDGHVVTMNFERCGLCADQGVQIEDLNAVIQAVRHSKQVLSIAVHHCNPHWSLEVPGKSAFFADAAQQGEDEHRFSHG